MSTPNSVVQSRDLSAILIADMHGYSRLMSKDEEGTRQRVARSIGLIKSLIGGYGGRVMNVAGDNLRLILKWLRRLLCKIIAAICAAITPFSTLKSAS